MGEIKWVKFEVEMYEDTKLKILDDTENRDLNHHVWARSLVLAGKINRGGYLYITDNMPHTIKTLSIEFNRSIEEIKSAYKILRKLEMIELTEDKVFRIKNWDKHQNVEGMERSRLLNNARVAKHRAKNKELNEGNNKKSNVPEDIHENKIEDKCTVKKADSNNKTDNKCGITGNGEKFSHNITFNNEDDDCNATVMEQNKKENKNKKEIKRESNNTEDIINKDAAYDKKTKDSTLITLSDNSSISKNQKENSKNTLGDIDEKPIGLGALNKGMEKQNINSKALELLMHYERLTGIPGIFDPGFIALEIDTHGENYVKMAINKAIEVKKLEMPYINGILKNWRREGYPKEEVKKNESGGRGKNNSENKSQFAGFKPKEPRKLTEAERRKIEANLI